jgi:hypothetical protein
MTDLPQPVQTRHEVHLQEQRTERKAEDQKLIKLKARLLAKIQQQQQPSLLARAS